MKLTDREKDFLRLVYRSPHDNDGWRNVSPLLWKFVVEYTRPELIEIEEGEKGGRVRLSDREKILIDYI